MVCVKAYFHNKKLPENWERNKILRVLIGSADNEVVWFIGIAFRVVGGMKHNLGIFVESYTLGLPTLLDMQEIHIKFMLKNKWRYVT